MKKCLPYVQRRPQCELQCHMKVLGMKCVLVIPVLGRRRQEDACISLASQSSQFGECQSKDRHYLKDKNDIPEAVLWSPYTCSQACMCTCILVLAYYFKNRNCILNLSQIFICKVCFIYTHILSIPMLVCDIIKLTLQEKSYKLIFPN